MLLFTCPKLWTNQAGNLVNSMTETPLITIFIFFSGTCCWSLFISLIISQYKQREREREFHTLPQRPCQAPTPFSSCTTSPINPLPHQPLATASRPPLSLPCHATPLATAPRPLYPLPRCQSSGGQLPHPSFWPLPIPGASLGGGPSPPTADTDHV